MVITQHSLGIKYKMIDELCSYIEIKLRPEKKLIHYSAERKKFYIRTDYSASTNNIALNIAEFYATYWYIIKPSPYYTDFMAMILASHAET